MSLIKVAKIEGIIPSQDEDGTHTLCLLAELEDESRAVISLSVEAVAVIVDTLAIPVIP